MANLAAWAGAAQASDDPMEYDAATAAGDGPGNHGKRGRSSETDVKRSKNTDDGTRPSSPADNYLHFLWEVAAGGAKLNDNVIAEMVKELGWGRYQPVPYTRWGTNYVVHVCPAIETLRYVGDDMSLAEVALFDKLILGEHGEVVHAKNTNQDVTNALLSSGRGETLELYATDLATQLIDAAVANPACAVYLVFRLYHFWEMLDAAETYEFRYYLAYLCQIAALEICRSGSILASSSAKPDAGALFKWLRLMSWGQLISGIDACVPQMLMRRWDQRVRPWMPQFPPAAIMVVETVGVGVNDMRRLFGDRETLTDALSYPYVLRQRGFDPPRNISYSQALTSHVDPYNEEVLPRNPTLTAFLATFVNIEAIHDTKRILELRTFVQDAIEKKGFARLQPPPLFMTLFQKNIRERLITDLGIIFRNFESAQFKEAYERLGDIFQLFRVDWHQVAAVTHALGLSSGDNWTQVLYGYGLATHGHRSPNNDFLLYAFGIDPKLPADQAQSILRRRFAVYCLRNFDQMGRISDLRVPVRVFRLLGNKEAGEQVGDSELMDALRAMVRSVNIRAYGVRKDMGAYTGDYLTPVRWDGLGDIPWVYKRVVIHEGSKRGEDVRDALSRVLFGKNFGKYLEDDNEFALKVFDTLQYCRKWIFRGVQEVGSDPDHRFMEQLFAYATTHPRVMWWAENDESGLVSDCMFRGIEVETLYGERGKYKVYHSLVPKQSKSSRANFVLNLMAYWSGRKGTEIWHVWVTQQSPAWRAGLAFAIHTIQRFARNCDFRGLSALIEYSSKEGAALPADVAEFLDANGIIDARSLATWRAAGQRDFALFRGLLGCVNPTPFNDDEDWYKWYLENRPFVVLRGLLAADTRSTFGFSPTVTSGTARAEFVANYDRCMPISCDELVISTEPDVEPGYEKHKLHLLRSRKVGYRVLTLQGLAYGRTPDATYPLADLLKGLGDTRDGLIVFELDGGSASDTDQAYDVCNEIMKTVVQRSLYLRKLTIKNVNLAKWTDGPFHPDAKQIPSWGDDGLEFLRIVSLDVKDLDVDGTMRILKSLMRTTDISEMILRGAQNSDPPTLGREVAAAIVDVYNTGPADRRIDIRDAKLGMMDWEHMISIFDKLRVPRHPNPNGITLVLPAISGRPTSVEHQKEAALDFAIVLALGVKSGVIFRK